MSRKRDRAQRFRGVGLTLRVVLYLALALSALVTMAALPPIQRRVEAGQLHPMWLLAPSGFFGLFLAIYLADRILLLRYRNYPAGRALFQIVFGLLFLVLLLPSSVREYRSVLQTRPPKQSLQALMKHSDARVRAVAFELAGRRPESRRYLSALGAGLNDRAEPAQTAAQDALMRITGQRFSTDKQGQQDLQNYLGGAADITSPPAAVEDAGVDGPEQGVAKTPQPDTADAGGSSE